MLAGRGQRKLLPATLEQRYAEKTLQHDDVPADGALCNREVVGRGREAQLLSGGLEGPQRIERQPAAVDGLRPGDGVLRASGGLPRRHAACFRARAQWRAGIWRF